MADTASPASKNAQPTQDELEDIILSARYGELEEIQEFVKKFGIQPLSQTRDDRGNGCLHMAAANGHKGARTCQSLAPVLAADVQDLPSAFTSPPLAALDNLKIHTDVISFLLPLVPSETLSATNQSGNTPLHWAAMNGHIDTLRLLVPALPKDALFLKNQFGRDALSEAENAVPEGEQGASSPQQECVGYLLTFMELEKEKEGNEAEVAEDPTAEEGEEGGTGSGSKSPANSKLDASDKLAEQDSRQ